MEMKKRNTRRISMKIRFIAIYLLSINLVLNGQTLNPTDSIEVCKVTNDFFHWYLAATNGDINSEFQPKFVESKNGMTTLDFKAYFVNLRKHNFSESLIKKERQSYNDCLKNLEKIKFTDFKNQFTCIAYYEDISCDFENYYRWTGGQESIHGIRIKNVMKVSKNQVMVTIEYSYDNGENYGISYGGNNKVTIVKTKNRWKIADINWRN